MRKRIMTIPNNHSKDLWPTNMVCYHCDDERTDNGVISLADCDNCSVTCCDACYEDYHCFGPCEETKYEKKGNVS